MMFNAMGVSEKEFLNAAKIFYEDTWFLYKEDARQRKEREKNGMITEDLLLLPAQNIRDNEPFLELLREGDFKRFCGVDFSEERLSIFENYFEKEEDFLFAIFPRWKPDELIGYVGFGKQNERYEAEFYISRKYRGKGYAYQALNDICKKASQGKLYNLNKKQFHSKTIFATILKNNIASIVTLRKAGFQYNEKRANIEKLYISVDEEIIENEIIEFYLEL